MMTSVINPRVRMCQTVYEYTHTEDEVWKTRGDCLPRGADGFRSLEFSLVRVSHVCVCNAVWVEMMVMKMEEGTLLVVTIDLSVSN